MPIPIQPQEHDPLSKQKTSSPPRKHSTTRMLKRSFVGLTPCADSTTYAPVNSKFRETQVSTQAPMIADIREAAVDELLVTIAEGGRGCCQYAGSCLSFKNSAFDNGPQRLGGLPGRVKWPLKTSSFCVLTHTVESSRLPPKVPFDHIRQPHPAARGPERVKTLSHRELTKPVLPQIATFRLRRSERQIIKNNFVFPACDATLRAWRAVPF